MRPDDRVARPHSQSLPVRQRGQLIKISGDPGRPHVVPVEPHNAETLSDRIHQQSRNVDRQGGETVPESVAGLRRQKRQRLLTEVVAVQHVQACRGLVQLLQHASEKIVHDLNPRAFLRRFVDALHVAREWAMTTHTARSILR